MSAEQPLGRGMVALLAVASGVAVGNIYFAQAITPLVAAGLRISVDDATLATTATQFGYAGGIFLLVPLVDRVPNHRLLGRLLTLAIVSLGAAAAAPSLPVLVGASLLVGVTTVAAPVIGSLAAGLAGADRRGAVSGVLLSGAIGGMLLSRVGAGALAEEFGWRAPYVVAASLTLAVAVVLSRVVPAAVPALTRQPYPATLAEPLRLLRQEPQLRRSCLYQACGVAGVSRSPAACRCRP
jgi:predicted MFS family arabinose efflux permease